MNISRIEKSSDRSDVTNGMSNSDMVAMNYFTSLERMMSSITEKIELREELMTIMMEESFDTLSPEGCVLSVNALSNVDLGDVLIQSDISLTLLRLVMERFLIDDVLLSLDGLIVKDMLLLWINQNPKSLELSDDLILLWNEKAIELEPVDISHMISNGASEDSSRDSFSEKIKEVLCNCSRLLSESLCKVVREDTVTFPVGWVGSKLVLVTNDIVNCVKE